MVTTPARRVGSATTAARLGCSPTCAHSSTSSGPTARVGECAPTRECASLPGCAFQTNFATIGNTINCRTQSGTLGGNEYSIRELYAKKTGAKTDLYLGRQYVPELAATKIDGLQFQHQVNKQWKLIGFGGLHPSRISRSLLDDYPKQVEINGQTAGPVLPIAAGMGGAYRTPSLYGSVGAVGIVPIANDRDTGLNENPRVFLTDNGYWRASGDLDVYHYLVFDLQSAAGLGLTNLSLGANYRPAPGITVSGAINRVDTETLNSIAQTEILEVPVNVDAAPYNYQKVLRVASDSAHLGVSAALARQRFEVSGRAFFRQREELQLIVPDENDPALEPIPAARSAEARISVLDRRSVGGMRLGLSFSSIIPISKNTPNRSTAQIVSITGSRMFMDDRMELDSNLTLVSSSDIKELGQCMAPANQIEDCYGNSDVLSVHTNNLLYYRFSSSWLGIANIGLGIQKISTDGAGQPINLLISGLVRAAYRF